MKDILGQTETKMKGALAHLQDQLKTLRTGRANPGMLDQVLVEVYGTSMRLKELANVSVPDARTLLVSPFDGSTVHAISKGITAANLNLTPIVDGQSVRIKVPEMDTATRQTMVKQSKKMGEDAKIAIRGVRRDANDALKKAQSEGLIPEDVQISSEKKVQKHTDDFCKKVDELCAQKEKEILTI